MSTFKDYKTICNFCGETNVISANPKDIKKWQNGALIQDAIPYLNRNQRELLISGMCGKCFETLLGSDME